jgi:hypothetical protein
LAWCLQCGGAAAELLVATDVFTATTANDWTTDFFFYAQSGVRYDLDVRVAPGGVTATSLWLLPPGVGCGGNSCDRTSWVAMKSRAVATQTLVSADQGIGFTATATGMYRARVEVYEGSGQVGFTATAIGTALDRAPPLQVDGRPHPLEISCYFEHCSFDYDGATVNDGDGTGFDLLLDAEAGKAYAFTIELPPGQTAEVKATFYQSNAAAGSVGFRPVVRGPMGQWPATPQWSESYAEYNQCSNDDRGCISDIPASYGIHPGGSFGPALQGTWVAPSAGKWLLRVIVNCAVVFYSDVQAEGCLFRQDGVFNCQRTADGTLNSECTSMLAVTVTPDAYFDDDSHTSQQAHASTRGEFERTDTLVLSRAGVEAEAARMYTGYGAPPTLEEMMVRGTAANTLLTRILTAEQRPHVVYPTIIEPNGGGGGGRRRNQRAGDGGTHVTTLVVTVTTIAPTPQDAQAAADRVADRVDGTPVHGRRRTQAAGQSQLTTTMTVDVATIEAQAAAIYNEDRASCPHCQYPSLARPPSIDDMLVGGSPAAGILASIFTNEQQPHHVEVASMSLQQGGGGGGHRRTQRTGDGVFVQIVTHAPTPAEAERAVQAIATKCGGGTVHQG